MSYRALFMDIRNWPVTVVGGGAAAAEKVRLLLKDGARVTVISPELEPELEGMAGEGQVQWINRPYAAGDLADARLVYAATPDPVVNQGVVEEAGRGGIPICVPDDTTQSSCLDPAGFQRGPVRVAVSAGGSGDVMDDLLLRKLELSLPAVYGPMSEIVDRYRSKARACLSSRAERIAFMKDLVAFLDGPEIHKDLEQGHMDGALAGARVLLDRHAQRDGEQ